MTNFKFDPAHSAVDFTIKHMMVSRIKGSFKEMNAEITGDVQDQTSLKVKASVKVASIDTGNTDRDEHLRSADFFNTEEYPEITFVSKVITDGEITGDLTIKDQTHEETFTFEYNGVHNNPFTKQDVTGVLVSGTINREKYGLTWNQALETGGVMVGKDVKFEASAEFTIED